MQHILETAKKWQQALSSGDAGRVTRLYDKDAVLWGTLSPVIRNTPGLIREYFERFATLQDISVNFHDEEIRQYGELAVNTGYYEFSWKDNGSLVRVPARYTFVYLKQDEWMIIDHHSSVVPDTPFDLSKYTDGI